MQTENLREPDKTKGGDLTHLSKLAGHILSEWTTAKTERQEISQQMLSAVRRTKGIYSPSKLAAIEAMGSAAPFIMLTSTKVRAVTSQIADVLASSSDEALWRLKPSPIPDTPHEIEGLIDIATVLLGSDGDDEISGLIKKEVMGLIMDDAEKRADSMMSLIQDQQEDTGYKDTVLSYISDLCIHPSAFLKFDTVSADLLTWDDSNKPMVKKTTLPCVKRVNPFYVFPVSSGMRDVNSGAIIEIEKYSLSDFYRLGDLPYFDKSKIQTILEKGKNGFSSKEWLFNESEMRSALNNATIGAWSFDNNLIDVISYNGVVMGSLLKDFGFTSAEPHVPYAIQAWMVDGVIIGVRRNTDLMGRSPYTKSSFSEMNDQFWGQGIPAVIYHTQDTVNSFARSAINSAAFSSAPMVEVNKDKLAAGTDVTKLAPWKIFYTKGEGKGIHFFQPKNQAGEFLKIMDYGMTIADEETMIPKYSYGGTGSGAASTASGLAMQLGQSSKGIREIIGRVDRRGLRPHLKRQYQHNMLSADVPDDRKGDFQIVPIGILGILAKEANHARQMEFLQLTTNPVDMQLLKPSGRSQVLHELAKSIGLPAEKIISDPDDINEKQKFKDSLLGAGGVSLNGLLSQQGEKGSPIPSSPDIMNEGEIQESQAPSQPRY